MFRMRRQPCLASVLIALAIMGSAAPVYSRGIDLDPPPPPALPWPGLPAPSTIEIATAHAETDRVISAGNAGEWFENITTGGIGMARHRLSGLICFFHPDRSNRIIVFPTQPGGAPPGDDVGCSSAWGETLVTLYATRVPFPVTDEDLMGHAVGELEGTWQNVEPVTDDYPLSRLEGQEPVLSYVFVGELGGRRLRSLILVDNRGEWSFKGRASGDPDDADLTLLGSFVYSISVPGGWEAFATE